jgi:hypothetical protein
MTNTLHRIITSIPWPDSRLWRRLFFELFIIGFHYEFGIS